MGDKHLKKIILKRLIWTLVIIITTIGITFLYKALSGIHIEHFAQYIYPCEGQIATLAGSDSVVSFHVFDEKDISELSEKNNIISIILVDQSGYEIVAKDWNIESAGFYMGKKHSAKQLSVTASFTEETTIKTLKIIYPDKTESFNIGSLTIRPIEMGELASYTQISSDLFTFDSSNRMVDEDSTFFTEIPSAILLIANSLNKDYYIYGIDFGLPGLGIDPSTLKFVSEDTDYGESFTGNPENEMYFLTKPLDVLPEQKINVEIAGEDFSYMIIALRQSKSFNTKPVSLYISPVFTCADKISGEQYLYADLNYYIMTPQIVNDEYLTMILKELGQ